MPTFKIDKSNYLTIKDGDKTVHITKKEAFDKFNQDILGLGNIENKSKQINALSVIFDLEGFTEFCKQIDPHLAVPEYLSEFLKWIFYEIRLGTIEKPYEKGYSTWADLPFLTKYLGDGILFLWNTENMSDNAIRNVVVTMNDICINYKERFFPKISKGIISPPPKLRCGIARGIIYSVGDGDDFVGPCINMSSRLQKLSSLTFSFSRRGIDPNLMGDGYKSRFLIKKVDIRGIGPKELVCVLKDEFNKMQEADKKIFKDI